MKFSVFVILFTIGLFRCTQSPLPAINFSNLQVQYSKNDSTRAAFIGQRINLAKDLYDSLFDFKPEVKLLILNREVWPHHTKMSVYGMPHYNNGHLIVAADENDFWAGFLPPLDNLPAGQAQVIKQTYADEGVLSMKKFFDLVAVHELGHAYHIQNQVNMQRKWLQELFANLVMYSYTAEMEPDYLPVIDVFSTMVVEGGAEKLEFRSLQDFENNYEKIANQAPQNYGWYQSKLNLIAKDIYEQNGITSIKSLWQQLKNEENKLNEDQLNELLINTWGQSLANEIINW